VADPVRHPAYSEGQILGANDLQEGLDGEVARAARHDRYLHSWGVAQGLLLNSQKATTLLGVPYKTITVTAGVAFNGSGREIVLPSDTPLSEADFINLNIVDRSDTTGVAWYPVFLIGRDRAETGRQQLTGACTTAQPTRIVEEATITFGRPAEADNLDGQEPLSDVSAGPDGQLGAIENWKVLLGFVQWNDDAQVKRFRDVSYSNSGAPPVTRRFAGVRADEVIARGGSVTLRTRPRGFVPDPNATPPTKPMVLSVDEARLNKELAFGFPDSDPVFTVSAKGDVAFKGSLSPGVAAGLQAESGIATDGMILPLPGNVTQAQVDGGQVVVHVHVTPASPFAAAPLDAGNWVPIAVDCSVDEKRRVHCRATWIDVKQMTTAAVVQTLGACDYTVLAAAPTAKGGS
jgi:hypothetical protein